METGGEHRLLAVIVLLSCTNQQVLPAGLSVSPSSSQFLRKDLLTLRCEDGWTLRREGITGSCGESWGRREGSNCFLGYLVQSDSGIFWCESREGGVTPNITINVYDTDSVILQSPVLPVMEGQEVTLSCRTGQDSTQTPVLFYKNGARVEPRLQQVSRSDEGLYWCEIGQRKSASSRLSVSEAPPTSVAPPTSAAPAHGPTIFRVLCHLLVFCPYFISTLIMVSLHRHMHSGSGSSAPMGSFQQAERGLSTMTSQPPPSINSDVVQEVMSFSKTKAA